MMRVARALFVLVLCAVVSCGRSATPPDADPLEGGLAAYEDARALLAADETDGLATAAGTAASALQAGGALEAAAAARELEAADDLDAARVAFGELSRHVVPLVAGDPDRAARLHRFSCPMAPGFGEWLQPSPEIANPYMGTAMPGCGSEEAWEAGDDHEHDHDEGDIAYWTCPMHPSVKEADSGTCPICSMDLTPVTREELESGAVLLDTVRRQRFGVRTATVEPRSLTREVRATGAVHWDESKLVDVTLRTEAWVERLVVSEPGQRVRRGQTLAVLYSPELYAAERELLAARGTPLEGSARDRLRLLGLTVGQIDAVLAGGRASDTVELLAPASGVVIDKHVVEGAHLAAGSTLYRLGATDRVWVEAEVYEHDLALVEAGMAVTLSGPGVARPLEGEVDLVQPWVDPATRRASVRVVAENPDGALLPGMYVDMTLRAGLGEALVVPVEAVIFTGRRRIVFVDEGNDRLVPRDVTLGRRGGEWIEVTSGLEAGQQVVRSGNFVVAAESRIRAAETYWGGDHEAR